MNKKKGYKRMNKVEYDGIKSLLAQNENAGSVAKFVNRSYGCVYRVKNTLDYADYVAWQKRVNKASKSEQPSLIEVTIARAMASDKEKYGFTEEARDVAEREEDDWRPVSQFSYTSDDDQVFRTKDLNLAGAILTAGIKFLGIAQDTENPRIQWFLFENYSECERMMLKYVNDDVVQNIASYMQNRKALKYLTDNVR